MHQVHAEAQLGERRDDARRGLVDGGEHEEEAVGGHQHVKRAELPAPLEHRCLDGNAGLALQPEAPCRECSSDEEADKAYAQAAAIVPLEVETDVVGQHEVAQIAGAVPQHVETVPKALAPQLVADKAVQPRHGRGEDKYPDEYLLLLCRSLLKPRRHDGNNQVEADEWIHEPEVAGHRGEVPRQAAEVGPRRLPCHAAPSQGQEAVQQHEDNHRGQDAQETATIEVGHAGARLHRHEQKGTDGHEQWHGDAAKGSIVEGYPEAVSLIGKH